MLCQWGPKSSSYVQLIRGYIYLYVAGRYMGECTAQYRCSHDRSIHTVNWRPRIIQTSAHAFIHRFYGQFKRFGNGIYAEREMRQTHSHASRLTQYMQMQCMYHRDQDTFWTCTFCTCPTHNGTGHSPYPAEISDGGTVMKLPISMWQPAQR